MDQISTSASPSSDEKLCELCKTSPISVENSLSLCDECKQTLIKRPFPIWIKGLGILVTVLFFISITKFPSSIAAGIAYERGIKAESVTKYVTAMNEYEKILKKYPDSTQVLGRLFIAYSKNDQIEKADQALKKISGKEFDDEDLLNAINKESDNFYGVYYYSDEITLIDSKKISVPKKIEEIEAYLVKKPDDTSAIILLGDLYYDLGDFNNAKVNYIKVLETAPSNIVVRLSIAAAYRELGKFDEAIKECNEALTQNIEASSTYASLSKIYVYMNNKSLALKNAQKAYSLDKNNMFSINTLIIADHYNGLFEERDRLIKVLEENKYYDLERTKEIISSKAE